ncbi:hypothetical protein A2707_05775 [Candidatus Saccharibacteria bacterium RIFCSPHIGHO2_01_FULL_45_15]|nr:MAG: hypothetical protein A2707_05775 [Candidatus Saccharibacteria bacterium RIFCSPHIGHO2_01_FULL_45_15]OGL28955.1 MAG: hypothetical protein A3C39_05995 [Candidatus Saccharibacteria bacterium RIFCSPHIGHO2_02_FULL_46_12]OGL31969.1 MAG: hypothetical protein A3E76_01720 [Candidatus Saccharibacteria bacterium RIFCSPHIGHO2_12_FULL_44_22]
MLGVSERLFANREIEKQPTAKQIKNFGRECVLFAHRHDQLRRSKDGKRFVVGPMSHYRAADLWDGEPFGSIYKDTYSVLASMTDGSIDSLKIIHGLVVENMGSNGGVFSQTYTFNSVLDAVVSNRSHNFGSKSHVKLKDMNLDNVYVPSDFSTEIEVEQEFAEVNRGDFILLTNGIKSIMARVDSGDLAYSEQRADCYSDYEDKQ